MATMKIADAFTQLLDRAAAPAGHGVRRQRGRSRGRPVRLRGAQRARPGLPDDRARRPRSRPRVRVGRPGCDRRAPGRPVRRAQGAAEGAEVPDAEAAGGDRPGAGTGSLPPQAAGPAAAGAPAALAPGRRGPAPLAQARLRGDPPPLRRLEHVLRVRPRPVDDLHLRGLPGRRRDARAGAVLQVRPDREEARPQAGHAAARRRLRLGRHGPPRGRALRREDDRRDPVARAGHVGAGEDQGAGPRRPRRGAAQRLPRGHRVRASTRSRRSASPSTSASRTTRRTSRSCATGCVRRAGCSTTASPGRTTIARRPARSSTATSSPTAS